MYTFNTDPYVKLVLSAPKIQRGKSFEVNKLKIRGLVEECLIFGYVENFEHPFSESPPSKLLVRFTKCGFSQPILVFKIHEYCLDKYSPRYIEIWFQKYFLVI